MSELWAEEDFDELITPDEQQELWKTLIFSDKGRPFLLAASIAHNCEISDNYIVDGTGKPVEKDTDLWNDIISDASKQAVAESPMRGWK